MGPLCRLFIYSRMQVRKATLILVICSLLATMISLTCSSIYLRTPFFFQGFETPNNLYLSQKYSSPKYQLQWVIFLQECIVILILITLTTILAFKIYHQSPSPQIGIFLMLSQAIMSQIVVVGHSIGILLQIGYFGGNYYADIATAALRSLSLLSLVIVLIINLYNFKSQPQQCIEIAPNKTKSASTHPDLKEIVKENMQLEIQLQQIQAFHKNRPLILPTFSPMAAFFEGIQQQAERTVQVSLSKPQDIRMTQQNQNEGMENDFTVQPIRSKKYQRAIKIPKLDLNKVKNSFIAPQVFFPSFAGIDISAIHHNSKHQNYKDEYDSSQSDSEVLQIEQALINKNSNLSQPFL